MHKGLAAVLSFSVFTAASAGAGCLDPTLTAEIGVWVDASRGITFAPGDARMTDRGTGEICYGWDVAATIKIVENGAVEYVVEQTNVGAVLYTLDAPASMGSCYTSSISARGAIWRASASDGPCADASLVDSNHDAASQPHELQSVFTSAVRSISTTYHWTGRRDASGNFFGYQGMAHIGGASRPMYDVYFRTVR